MSSLGSPDDSRRSPSVSHAYKWIIAIVAAIAALGITYSLTSQAGWWQTSKSPGIAESAGTLADQKISWEPCKFPDGPPAEGVDTSNVECATIQVPKDWLNPDIADSWDVRISQAKNIEPSDADYNTTLMVHPGGPSSGLSFAATTQASTPELRSTTNYVSFDQRGVGQSSHAECEYEYDPTADIASQTQAIGYACSQDPDVATISTEQAAYDMEFIRHLLGVDTVSYLGYSYGTWLGAWYGNLFPESIDRMVLDSALNVQAPYQDVFESQNVGRDRQFRLHMMNWVARNDATYGLGTDPEAIWERYFTATEAPHMEEAAGLVWTSTSIVTAFSKPVAYPAMGELVSKVIAEGESPTDPASSDPVQTATRIVDRMGPAVPDPLRQAAYTSLEAMAESEAGEAAAAPATYDAIIDFTRCTDGRWTQGLDYWEDYNERTAETSPISAQLGQLDGPPTCAFWPSTSEMPAANDGFPETIVVQSELDALSPFEQGRASGSGLPNTTLIAVDNESIHGVFPYGTEQVDRPVLDFLAGGPRPEKTIIANAKPLPLEETSFEAWGPIGDDADHRDAEPRFTDPAAPAAQH
ncbi:alpha/beta fold hydrolase [Rhodoglobus sp.]